MSTAFLEVKNDAAGNLAATITAGATQIELQGGHTLPAAFPFDVTVDNEIMRVTSSAGGNTYNVTRAQQATTAAVHSTDAAVELRITAKLISDLDTAVNVLEGGGTPGQTLIGGTGATDTLTLKPSSNASPTGNLIFDLQGAGQQVELKPPASITASFTAMTSDDAVTIGVGGQLRALFISNAVTMSGAVAGTAFSVFNFAPVVTLDTSTTTNLANGQIFRDRPTVNLSATPTVYGVISNTWNSFNSDPVFAANGAGSTGTITALTALNVAPEIGTGFTITTRRGVWIQTPALTGTITNEIGVDIEDLDAFAGTNTNPILSIISRGSVPEMQHAGPAVFGAADAAVPTASIVSGVSVGLEVQSTTRALLLSRMTTTQRDALTPIEGMVIYNSTTRQMETYDNVGGTLGWTAQIL